MKNAKLVMPLLTAAFAASMLQAAPAGIHPSYTAEKIRPAAMSWPIGDMDFFKNGDLAVASWKDPYDVYILKNATGPASGITMSMFATGLTEVLGLVVVNDTIFVMQKDELTALIDNDNDGKADEYRTIANRYSKSTMEKEYAGGLAYDGTYFYGVFGDQTINSGTAVDPMMPGRLNGALRFSRDGTVYPYAGGFRVPLGAAWIYGELWSTENQGGYRPSNPLYNVREKRWYGRPVNPPSVYQPGPYVKTPDKSSFYQAAVWMPYHDAGGYSPGNPMVLPNGPFKGQILVPDASTSGMGVCRNFIEKVKGEYQGATLWFSRKTGAGGFEQGVVLRTKMGPDGAIYCGANGANGSNWGRFTHIGLDRLKLTNTVPMDILAVRNMGPNTMEFEFTKPLNNSMGNDIKGSISGDKWFEQPTEAYGGGHKTGAGGLSVSAAAVSSDRKKVTVTVSGLQDKGYVHHFKLSGVTSSDGQGLWGDEAWYTLNNFGPGEDVSTATLENAAARGANPFEVSRGAGGEVNLRVALPENTVFQAQLADLRGRVYAKRQGSGRAEFVLGGLGLSGIYVVKVSTGNKVYSQIISR
jgi:cytochrome c